MKFKLLRLTVLLLSLSMTAKDYYVSINGKDTNNGNLQSPFRTIQKAADMMAAGDTCYILAGTYRENVVVKQNNTTFKNYNGQKVTVSGADQIKNWSIYKDGIYSANFSGAETEYTMLFLRGKRQEMARWPDNKTGEMMNPENKNSGYEDCQVFTGVKEKKNRRVLFPNMTGFPSNFFKGGIFRGINGKKWINPMGIITASNGKELRVDAITEGWIDNSEKIFTDNGKGFGFIFHLNALNREGEWFQQGNKIYFKPPNGTNPNNLLITAKNRKWAFQINRKNGVKIQGLNIHAASIQMDKSSNCQVVDSSIQYLWPFFTRKGYGVSRTEQGGVFVNGNNNKFTNCYIAHSWGHGLFIDEGKNTKIKNCFIEDIGWIAQFTSSIQNNGGDGTEITKTTLGSTGRFHIRTNDGKIDITYNDLYDCMKMGQDAGSIQCTNGGNWGVPVDMKGSEIAYNRIHDSNTLTDGHKEFVLALYLEGCYNYTVHHNLIYNFKTDVVPDGTFAYLGPRQAKIKDSYFYNNTVWNMDWGIRIWNRDNKGKIENIRFWNNIIDTKAKDDDKNHIYQNINFQNNVRNVTGNGNALFVNAAQGDFRLKQGTSPINNGRFINGITTNVNGPKPDVGAIEYGSSFPDVGSTLNPNDFNSGNHSGGNTSGERHIIPGKIEAEDFLTQSGVRLENTTDTGGGKSIGYIENGDHTEYLVTVKEAGEYKISARVASLNSSGKINVTYKKRNIGELNVVNTGGWQSWKTVTMVTNLTEGDNKIRLDFSGGNGFLFNLNWLSFKKMGSNKTINIDQEDRGSYLKIIPNPIKGGSMHLFQKGNTKLKILNMSGAVLKELTVSQEETTIDVSGLADGIYVLKSNTNSTKFTIQ